MIWNVRHGHFPTSFHILLLFSGLRITIDTDDGLKNITVPKSDVPIGTYHQVEIKQEYNNQTKFMIFLTMKLHFRSLLEQIIKPFIWEVHI